MSSNNVNPSSSRTRRKRSKKGKPFAEQPFRAITQFKNGFPARLRMTHKYSDAAIMTSTSGSLDTYQMKCNGMFDPNQTGTGSQPAYFDQMCALYQHWVVLRSRITIQIFTTGPTRAVLYVDDDTSLPTTVAAGMLQPTAEWVLLPASQGVPITLTKDWDAVKNFGPGTLANSNFLGTSGADPTEVEFYTFLVSAMDPTSSTTTSILWLIEYEAEWFELKNIAYS